MPYVERDGTGRIKGCYGIVQPGYAEEYLPDDHPDVIAFKTRVQGGEVLGKREKAILLAVAALTGKTSVEARAAFKAAWDSLS